MVAVDAAGNESKAVKANVAIKDVTPPEKVTGIAVAAGADQNVARLSWAVPFDNVGVASYEVVLESGRKFTAKTNSIELKKLAAGRETVTVYALDKAKNRSEGVRFGFDVRDSTAPKNGKVTAVQSAADKVTLTMTGFSDNVGIASYRIYLDGTRIGETAGESFVFRRADLAGKLTFSVVAVDAAGNESKAVKANVAIKDVTPPEKVTGVRVEVDDTTATIRWNAPADNVGVASYDVVIDGKHYSAKTNSFVFKKMAPNTTYRVSVAALDKAKNVGVASDAKTFGMAVVPAADETAPGKVTGVRAVLNGSKATITWNAATDNVGVVSYRITANGKTYTSTRTTLELTGLVAGTTYNLTVQALDAAGNVGAASDVCSFRYSSGGTDTPPQNSVRLHTDGVVVESASSMRGKTVAGNQFLVAESGGSVIDTVVDGGTLLVSRGGVASSTVIKAGQGSAADATFETVTLKQGYLTILDSAVARNVTLSGGALVVRNFGRSVNNRLLSGSVDVSSGGMVTSTTLSSGNHMRVGSGGTASETVVDGGTLLVSRGGVASSTVIKAGQGSAADATFETVTLKQGYLTILDSAVARNVTLSGGALVVRNFGRSVNNRILSGSVDVSSGGVVTSTTVASGIYMRVGRGGTASETVLSAGAHAVVSGGGIVTSAEVRSGAGITVSTGGSAHKVTVSKGGSAYVSGGALVTDMKLVGDCVKIQLGIDSATNVHFSSDGVEHTVVNGALSDITARWQTYLEVSSGGVVRDLRLGDAVSSGGAIELFSNGLAVGVANHNFGQVNVFSGGFLSSASTDSEGEIYLFGGHGADLRADSGGYIWMYPGCVVHRIELTSVGKLAVSKGASAYDVVISSGGHAIVEEATGYLTGGLVHSGGVLEVCGGNADQVTVRKGGLLTFSSGYWTVGASTWHQALNGHAQNVILSGGLLAARYTGSATDVTALDGASVQVSSASLVGKLRLTSGTYAVVNENGTLNDAHVESGAQLDVKLGATASALRIDEGARVDFDFAAGMNVNGRVVGRNFTGSGGVLSGYTQMLGVLTMKKGTSASALQVSAGGRVNLADHTETDGLTVASGGLAYLYGSARNVRALSELHLMSGGAVSTMAVSGGYTTIHGGATASAVRIAGAGRLLVSNGTSVDGLEVDSGGVAAFHAGAELRTAMVNSGGTLQISAGATVSGLVTSAGAYCYIYGSAENIRAAASLHVMSGGAISAVTMEAGYAQFYCGATGDHVQIESDAHAVISSGGRVKELGIHAGASVVASAGAVIDGLQTDGVNYVLTMKSDSVLTGTIALARGRVFAEAGAVIRVDVSQSDPSGIPWIRGLEYLTGTGTFEVNVASAQKTGSYAVACYSDEIGTFSRDIAVTVNGVSAGTLNPESGGSIDTADRTFSFVQVGDTLRLTVGLIPGREGNADSSLWSSAADSEELGLCIGTEYDLPMAGPTDTLRNTTLAALGS